MDCEVYNVGRIDIRSGCHACGQVNCYNVFYESNVCWTVPSCAYKGRLRLAAADAEPDAPHIYADDETDLWR